ncbi:hypothetical protein BH780_gp235 [Bacillus phage Eldridge]|uniref:Uncharacterized protein n=1 Tax=Bacillus phage Eldridge TaxID=1776293 RepID=A0A0Y0AVA7_9CAUD|nr:hypothetical protein BH780_gp005 [Bacillus phage Eldridge]YP_009274942.1 hypothetical protein BH780_gp235 [Bacillus phage Eldridge]AMB18816.1 hypothetical protein Eldridge_05 [Bacillus phage Eldridge]AMB18823.1 hypothetical protein Eldridge_0238 [Bacillus phage Eldridge]
MNKVIEGMQKAINSGACNDSFGDLHRHKLLLAGEKIAKEHGVKLSSTQLNEITIELFLKNLQKGKC